MTTFEEIITHANVLIEEKNYKKAILHYKDAVFKTDLPEYHIDIFNVIGKLYLSLQDFNNTAVYFGKSLLIHNKLPEERAKKLKVNKATILNNLGIIILQKDAKLAIKYHKEALEIFKNENEINPNIFTLHIANTHYSYGDACYLKKDYYMSRKQYNEAIAVYGTLEDISKAEPFIANAHYNLGNIYTDENNIFDAKNHYLKGLKIFKKLTEEQPEAYRSLLAATFNNLAVTAKIMFQYDDAIVYYENALKEYEALIAQDPATFLPFYAATLNSIGIIYTEQHEIKDDYASKGLSGFSGFGILAADNVKDERKEKATEFQKGKAVEYYQKALKVYDDLTKKEPETYTHYVATCLHNLGVLYDGKKEFKLAEEHYEKALNIRRDLANKQPRAFNLDTCVTLLNITTMYQNLLEQTGNIGFKTESLKILKEIEDRLSIYADTQKPVILSMKSDTEYFTKYFNEVDAEYLDILDKFALVDVVTEKIKETLIPSEKLKLQKDSVILVLKLRKKYPNNERIQAELLDIYTQYAWFALRSNNVFETEKAIKEGLKINPESLSLKANYGHLYLLKDELDKAKNIYRSLKDVKSEENELFFKVLTRDFDVLKNDGVLTKNMDKLIADVIG